VRGSSEFTSVMVPMKQQTLNANYYYGNNGLRTNADDMLGIWIRVYTSDGQMLQEWCSSPDLMKKEKWTDK
jgi:hypothetical protein